MVITSVIILIVLSAGVIYILRRPFNVKTPEYPQAEFSDPLLPVKLEYDQVIKRLTELEFESKFGKLSVEDHDLLANESKQKAADLLSLLDEKVSTETEIIPGTQVERDVTKRRMQRRERTTGFCSSCGKTLQKSDRFCPKCGVKV